MGVLRKSLLGVSATPRYASGGDGRRSTGLCGLGIGDDSGRFDGRR
jgi:hypothetical protein